MRSEDAGELYYRTKDWWTQNASKITLHDPWLAILKPQRVD